MAVTDDDRREMAELAMKALDALADHGDDVVLDAACIVFEVSEPTSRGRLFSQDWRSLGRNSPLHIAALLDATASQITEPVAEEGDDD